jgi:tetratricopeptide (TPR) repeat protein
MTQESRTAASGSKKQAASPNAAGFQQYEAALQLLQQNRFDKALAAFEKLLPTAPAQLTERIKMYMDACKRQLQDHALSFLTPEEHYDYAVSQLNTGYFEEAREQFNEILAQHPSADYAYYGLALLDSMMGRIQECLANLTKAIEMNPKNRLQARVDNDFQNMADDPRFTELLYPENP